MKLKILKKNHFWLGLILLLALFLRFGGISWGLPHSFHPDERNMAMAVSRLSWGSKFNPEFFAYGQFPLYLAYLSAKIYNLALFLDIGNIDITEAIFFLRFWSTITGVGTVYLVYLISKRFLATNYSLLATLFAAFTPGLIQISHFGTTESLLSFLLLSVSYLSVLIYETKKTKYFIFLGIILGISFGTKITALTFTAPFGLTLLLLLKRVLAKSENKKKELLKLVSKSFLVFFLTLTLAIITSPYLVLAFKDSKNTLLYETAVATGKSPVFYTRQFINTIPVVFQLQKIFPYVLGWPIFFLGTLGIFWGILSLFSKKDKLFRFQLLILIFTFLVYFFSQAFLYCKWTRFIAPVFAFFPVFAALFIERIISSRKKFVYFLIGFLVITSILPGVLFSQIYFYPDIRFQASEWIYQNIPPKSQILFDTGNVVDVPILPPNLPNTPNLPNYHSISFDFYHLDENSELLPKLLNYLEKADYIIVPSRRIFMNHLRLPEEYPTTAKYYELLFSGELGFTEIQKIESFYSKIFKDEVAEETFTVFDHPTARIYKKEINLTKNDYERLFR